MDQGNCGASVGNIEITDLFSFDDAVIFAELLDVLVTDLEALHEEMKPLRAKIKVQEAYWMKQYSLFMHVARTLRS